MKELRELHGVSAVCVYQEVRECTAENGSRVRSDEFVAVLVQKVSSRRP